MFLQRYVQASKMHFYPFQDMFMKIDGIVPCYAIFLYILIAIVASQAFVPCAIYNIVGWWVVVPAKGGPKCFSRIKRSSVTLKVPSNAFPKVIPYQCVGQIVYKM